MSQQRKQIIPPELLPSNGRNLSTALGLDRGSVEERFGTERVQEYINIKLAALGLPTWKAPHEQETLKMSEALLEEYRERTRRMTNFLPPADRRIQAFLNDYLAGVDGVDIPRLPSNTLTLDRYGLARQLSLPPDRDAFSSDIVSSFRLKNGVLHNPAKDRRTTKGVFHVTEGGLPIPADKKAVPKKTFSRILRAAMNPPESIMQLPFTSAQEDKAATWVSLLLRPLVCPAVPGFTEEKTMEVRFFVPGNLVCNLDFVESIFGNAGDPTLAWHDAALDVAHWTGHTGCVILAPQIEGLKKKDLGLPHVNEATDRQKADGMCWEDPEEIYNDGGSFKITARDERGVVVTLISDNYFGYCKKEVKTQISFASNLYGSVEEEHAGGATAFPSYDLGESFRLSEYLPEVNHTFDEFKARYGEFFDAKPEGYGIDKLYPDIIYIPQDSHVTLHDQRIRWTRDGKEQEIKLVPDNTYILPSGYKVEMVKPGEGRRWRLVGTRSEGTFCHKPCTVSGGGKSEISKSIADAIIHGPVITMDFKADMEQVKSLLNREYGMRFKDTEKNREHGRPILSTDRSLGSVIKLFTPSADYTDEYNAWLQSIPTHIKEFLFIIKRLYKPDWEQDEGDWMDRFSVDMINGVFANELRYQKRKLLSSYLRMGFGADGSWRVFSLRKDFNPAAKIQEEDDITASIVVPADGIAGRLSPVYDDVNPSVKFSKNCEYRFFQRPDEAIVRGYDKQAEWDLSNADNFVSNFQQTTREEAREYVEDSIRFDQFTEPMRDMIEAFSEEDDAVSPKYCVVSSRPRIVDGKYTKNPRYLQVRPDVLNPRGRYIAKMGTRLYRRLEADEPVPMPVNAVLGGRRNNPKEDGVRPLAVYNPIHYMELPELFMEFISSMTGKSPSTTGAGSEGALTKAPFNALPPVYDLNASLVSFIVSGYSGFITCAGHCGPKVRVDHDISLLVPEVWCRMRTHERQADYLIENGLLDNCANLSLPGVDPARAGRLGWRINRRFTNSFLGRIFSNPDTVFTDEMLAPETQDADQFIDGLDNVHVTDKRVAQFYFDDGSVEDAIPPLKALLHIMATGDYQGKTVADPEIRALFNRETVLASDWYAARLASKQAADIRLNEMHIANLEEYAAMDSHTEVARSVDLEGKLKYAREQLARVRSEAYLQTLKGTIGRQPISD